MTFNFQQVWDFLGNLAYQVVSGLKVVYNTTIGKVVIAVIGWFSLFATVFRTFYERFDAALWGIIDMFANAQVPVAELGNQASAASSVIQSNPAGAYMIQLLSLDVLAGGLTLITPFVAACVLAKITAQVVKFITFVLPGF